MTKFRSALALCAALTLGSPALAAQPHMEAALGSLQQARAELEKATADKGGHRAKAMQTIDRAIDQVKAGIEWDRKHTSPAERAKK
jgi:hypothetical protein